MCSDDTPLYSIMIHSKNTDTTDILTIEMYLYHNP